MRTRFRFPLLPLGLCLAATFTACDSGTDADDTFVAARAGTYAGSVYATPPGTTAEQNLGAFTVTLADQGNGRATLTLDDRSLLNSDGPVTLTGRYTDAEARFVYREFPSSQDSFVVRLSPGGVLSGGVYGENGDTIPITGTLTPRAFQMTVTVFEDGQNLAVRYAATRR